MLSRLSSIVLLLAFGIGAQAQSPGYYFFRSEAPVQPGQFKALIEAVMNTNPNAEIFHSDDMTILQVKHNGVLSEQEARTLITGAGVALRAEAPTAEELGPNTIDPNGPPVYVITGDETADQARYSTAVEIWNSTHPEQQFSTTPIHRQ